MYYSKISLLKILHVLKNVNILQSWLILKLRGRFLYNFHFLKGLRILHIFPCNLPSKFIAL